MSVFDLLTLSPQGSIGDIDIQASLEEVHNDTLQVTEHPVESGAQITDHSYKKPSEVVLRCGWSNSSSNGLTGAITGLFAGGELAKADYVSSVYSQLRQLQESRVPFAITTSLCTYKNMLITALQVNRDQKTSQVLMVSATCREVIRVSTLSTSLPDKSNQATPANTAEVENVGSKQIMTGSPSPGGSAPPSIW